MASTHKYVVLGGGNAAGYIAKAFAEAEPPIAKDDLVIVGRETVAPYERPALSKAFLFADPPARLPGFHTSVGGGGTRQDPQWYEDKGIKLLLGEEVTSVDVDTKTLKTKSGKEITGESLILATGAAPVELTMIDGHDLNGIYYLRENDDGLKLYDALKANKDKTVIVVGGGYIGLETAAAANLMGLKVKMIFPEKHIMPRLFNEEIATFYEKYYESKGIELLKDGRLCSAFLPDGKGGVRGVLVCRGDEKVEIAGDLVIVGVGARPNVALVKDQLEMAMGGIKVNSKLESSVPGVYAIGDIATFPLKMYGDRLTRMEHVAHARSSANHVVGALTGAEDGYDYLPYFYSRVFDLSWQFFGDSDGEVTVVGKMDPKLVAFWVKDSQINGAFMEGPSAEETTLLRAAAQGRPKVDVESLAKAGSVEEALAIIKGSL
eukprot:CAMPEP_0198314158 /NCGR_PEP_ID=MMETSP1450-20131203/4916_1 /TAXON_ID=753684 ORGANISM="Madagascaria erythrocladiodes, Strain CCMP3234" /NCGR_SAMPLE_ID=MMETSP1450 /ASSEMBLY_ACC=CAM_ASM_001115 /LENGTH=433 /DNA_ID=CAMNT_0044017197 /DNA_START=88 /DNA_END=1389 /DNA_ORIENTATION=+